ncbi:hypothetical protein QRO11_12095 [Paracidovorax citrulli]|uniref:hypothetical protein n=1 Tax=Paracidovorax citrulli TaxID=80869 RepID=UPI0005FC2558|nr:hypothetical protein [Paracidovorax citrulli]UMT88366.1 hypothetical protein FRC90_09980 [Paracidovorax citrulli]WIY32725.1 hypothetical protein QRO11_12095 [Paracidovorax citrulli]SDJ31564.1 hypothetical protein SAMN04489709_10384 [Paracidovorax citrulli]
MTNPRTLEEAYASAANTADLRVQADQVGDADLLIAAGWCQSRLGGALLRLHSEWDATSRPRTATAAEFLRPGAQASSADRTAARAEATAQAHVHNLHETALQLARCKSLPAVREQLVLLLRGWGAEAPDRAVAAILRWWLGPTCTACSGRRYEAIPGTDRLSAKACRQCKGTGHAPIPQGELGRRLANYLDECVHSARGSMGRRLHRGSKAA